MRDVWVGEVDDAATAADAVRRARQAGATEVDAWGPYGDVELEEALAVDARAGIPAWGLVGAVLGGGGAYLLQWWTAAVSWPLDVGGRPLHSAPSFVPLTFELAVLGTAIAVTLRLLWACGFPRVTDPAFGLPGMARASVDRFVVAAAGGEAVARALREAGARVVLVALTGCATAQVDAAPDWGWQRMLVQQKVDAGDVWPVDVRPGGAVPFDTPAEAPATIAQGRERFATFCAPCHGEAGDSATRIARDMTLRPPAVLVGDRVRALDDDAIARAIREGYGLMPAYGGRLTGPEVGAIVEYVRALQLAAGARLDELPPDVRAQAARELPP